MRVLACAVVVVLAAGVAGGQERKAAAQYPAAVVRTEQGLSADQCEAIVRDYDRMRQSVAGALYYLAEQYRKQGRAEEAIRAYTRIVREFGDREELVRASRDHLARSFGVAAPDRPDPRTPADETRAVQQWVDQERERAAVLAEIQTLRQRYDREQRLIDVGLASASGSTLTDIKMRLTDLEYRLTRLQEPLRASGTAAVIEQLEREHAMVTAEIQSLEERVASIDRRVQIGTVTVEELRPVQARLEEARRRLQRVQDELHARRQQK